MNSHLLNNIAENNTIGMTQFKSIKKPKIKFPSRAPPRPNVSDKAAAITLYQRNSHRTENNHIIFLLIFWDL